MRGRPLFTVRDISRRKLIIVVKWVWMYPRYCLRLSNPRKGWLSVKFLMTNGESELNKSLIFSVQGFLFRQIGLDLIWNLIVWSRHIRQFFLYLINSCNNVVLLPQLYYKLYIIGRFVILNNIRPYRIYFIYNEIRRI